MFGLDNDDTLRFAYLAVLLVLLVGSVGIGRGRRAGQLRHLGVWLLIVGALIVAYTYREPVLDFARPVLAELTPSRAMTVQGPDGQQSLAIRRSSDGHFHLEGGRLACPDVRADVQELYFRPEDAIVVPAGEASLVGCIDEVQFLGDRTRLTLSGVSSAGAVLVEVSSRRECRVGDRVGLSLPAAHVFSLHG